MDYMRLFCGIYSFFFGNVHGSFVDQIVGQIHASLQCVAVRCSLCCGVLQCVAIFVDKVMSPALYLTVTLFAYGLCRALWRNTRCSFGIYMALLWMKLWNRVIFALYLTVTLIAFLFKRSAAMSCTAIGQVACTYVYTHIYLFICIYTHSTGCLFICIYTHIPVYMYRPSCLFICIYTHACLYVYTHIYLFICIYTHSTAIGQVACIYVYTHIHTYMYMHTYIPYVYAYVRVYIYMIICVYTHV